MRRSQALALLAGCFCTFASGAQPAGRPVVEDFKVLLVAAIDSPSGEAHGILGGQVAEALTTTMKATSPVFIDVATEKRYRQAGCSRLKVTFSQEGVQLPGSTTPRRQTLDLGLNYCRDGSPPKSLL